MTKQTSSHSRRHFLRSAGVGTVAALAAGGMGRQTASAADVTKKPGVPALKLAMASYTLRKFDLTQTLDMTKQVGLDAICLKSFHMPLDATVAQIQSVAAATKAAGIRLYGVGVIYMKKEEDVNEAFEYAKAAGAIRIVGVPAPDLLPMVEQRVKQYDIEVCIHNHGPGDNTYPTPDVVYEKIKGLDRRIGLCHDIGHTVRSGKDPAKLSRQCADRMLDVHFKDVTAPEKAGHAIACGRGVIDIPDVLRTLVEIGYKGYVSFEYEADAKNPLLGVAESVGYVRGAIDML